MSIISVVLRLIAFVLCIVLFLDTDSDDVGKILMIGAIMLLIGLSLFDVIKTE